MNPHPITGDNFLLCHWCRIWSKRCLLSSLREVPHTRKGMERGIRGQAEGRREKARRGDSPSLYDCNTHTKSSAIVGSLANSIQEELIALMLCQNNGSALNYKMFKIYDCDLYYFEGENIDAVETTWKSNRMVQNGSLQWTRIQAVLPRPSWTRFGPYPDRPAPSQQFLRCLPCGQSPTHSSA